MTLRATLASAAAAILSSLIATEAPWATDRIVLITDDFAVPAGPTFPQGDFVTFARRDALLNTSSETGLAWFAASREDGSALASGEIAGLDAGGSPAIGTAAALSDDSPEDAPETVGSIVASQPSGWMSFLQRLAPSGGP